MKVELRVWNRETCSHEPVQTVDDDFARLDNLEEKYEVSAVYTYPTLGIVIYATPLPAKTDEQKVDDALYTIRQSLDELRRKQSPQFYPEPLPSPAEVSYQLDVQEAAHEESSNG